MAKALNVKRIIKFTLVSFTKQLGFLLALCAVNVGVLSGQTFSFTYPELAMECDAIIDIVPRGWSIIDSASGHLNKDKIRDVALVLQLIDSVELITDESGYLDTTITRPRMLAILFGAMGKHRFKLQHQSNTFILRHDTPYMDDPFDGLRIDDDVLAINFRFWYSWGSWWTTEVMYKFRFQQNEFTLIGFESNSFHRATMESKAYSINFLTRKYKITVGKEGEGGEDDYKQNIEWKTFKLDPLKTLRTFKRPMTWDFEGDITI
jgi:hypothetical protein